MDDVVEAGAHVEIRWIALDPSRRAPTLPPETRATPYIVRARGILLNDATVGDLVTIRTQAGRTIEGELEAARPADTHTFGRPPEALVQTIEAIQESKRRADGS